MSNSLSKEDMEVATIILWIIWPERNECLHKSREANTTKMGIIISGYLEELGKESKPWKPLEDLETHLSHHLWKLEN